MNWKKRAGRVLITGLLMGLLFTMGCGGSKEQAESVLQKKVVIGCDNYAPFSYTDENGSATGIDVDLAKEAFRRLGYACEFKTIDWEKKNNMLEDGEIDCIWSCYSMDGREEDYHWAGPYMVSRHVIAVNENSNIYKLSDLKGKVIAVQSTTKPESIILNHENSAIPQVDAVYSMGDRTLIYTSLAGRAVSENALLERTSHVRNAANPFYVKDVSGKSYIGNMEKTQDFYIYIFLPVVQVYDMLRVNMLCALLGYVCMILVLYAIKRRTDQQYQEIQQQRENEYWIRLMESAKKAERANMAKTEFLQRMSHDIRTPINGIRGMIEVANHYADDSEKQMECRNKIWEVSGFLLELINEVLDMGKLESGEIVLEERLFSFKKILYEVIDVVEKQAKESGIEMIIHPLEVEHWYLIGSPMYVKRLLMNIMSNAVKYNKKNGKIFITCREYDLKEDQVTIEFICEDTGIGMSPEFQQHLFEPFAQEQSGARSAYGGTGLGMSITKSITEKMNGSITFESEQGVGTTFHLRIPFIIDKESDIEEKNEKEISLNGITVLIAEDNELNMEIAEFMLQNAGATVIKASDGQDAVDRFVESEPGQIDIILMDIMMPVMDGLMATGRIRTLNRPDAQTIPIIAMTANAFMEDRIQALNAGMDEHLTKPLESAVLIRTIAEFVRKNGSEKRS